MRDLDVLCSDGEVFRAMLHFHKKPIKYTRLDQDNGILHTIEDARQRQWNIAEWRVKHQQVSSRFWWTMVVIFQSDSVKPEEEWGEPHKKALYWYATMLHAMRSFLWKVKGLKNIMVRSTEFVKSIWGHVGLKAGLTHVLANCPDDANFNIGDWSRMTGPSGDG
jgi:hypothetical protein